jgi:hypothetical protein
MSSPADKVPRRCGHNPARPRLDPSWQQVAKPEVLRKAKRGADSIYWDRHTANEDLRLRRKGRRSKASPLRLPPFRVRPRSDRYEAVTATLKFALDRCDVRNERRVGEFRDGEWKGFYSVAELATAVGISRWRMDHVLQQLVLAGCAHRHAGRDLVEAAEGTRYASRIATFHLTYKAFEMCGVTPAEVKAFMRRQEVKEESRAPVPPAGTLVSTAIDPAVADLRPSLPRPPADELRALAFQVAREHPEWADDVERVEREALRRWRPPPGSN